MKSVKITWTKDNGEKIHALASMGVPYEPISIRGDRGLDLDLTKEDAKALLEILKTLCSSLSAGNDD